MIISYQIPIDHLQIFLPLDRKILSLHFIRNRIFLSSAYITIRIPKTNGNSRTVSFHRTRRTMTIDIADRKIITLFNDFIINFPFHVIIGRNDPIKAMLHGIEIDLITLRNMQRTVFRNIHLNIQCIDYVGRRSIHSRWNRQKYKKYNR